LTSAHKLILIILTFCWISKSQAQVCTGALGDPIAGAGTDFGRGNATVGPSIPETNYTYVTAIPNDGQYTIVKTTAGQNGGWHQNVTNHTANDPDGYFMVANAGLSSGTFYEAKINNLCQNTTYEFAAYVINILRNVGVKPNIKFTIENNGVELTSFSTGDIMEGSPTDWKKYGTTFKTPVNIGTITLRMTNQNPGGNGNDVGIDDITFRACGPVATVAIDNSTLPTANTCVGEAGIYTLNVNVSAGYQDEVYRWQKLNGSVWDDVPGQTGKSYSPDLSNAAVGIYKYRLAIAERSNIGSPTCRVASPELTIIVNPKPNPIASNSGPACVGSNLQLNASEGVSFKWTGPNGYTSTDKNPILSNVDLANAGTYQVTVTNASGCSNAIAAATVVSVLPPIVAGTNLNSAQICAQESVNLVATGGTTYLWSPAEGLSDANIPNPIASPTKSTIYTVKIANGACEVNRSIEVIVLAQPQADAGENKKLLNGQSVILNGKVTGDQVTYFWSPATYLDDPTKLNPIATPPESITYTLHVQSICGIVSATVQVKVYPKIEIPNAFTPNGDGVNDTWNIPAISAFETTRLRVVNRYGQLVYESNKNMAWDGKRNGKDLPTGTYYYTLYLNEDFKTYSGWLLLTR
jgi:gliding motility-associated-like protein